MISSPLTSHYSLIIRVYRAKRAAPIHFSSRSFSPEKGLSGFDEVCSFLLLPVLPFFFAIACFWGRGFFAGFFLVSLGFCFMERDIRFLSTSTSITVTVTFWFTFTALWGSLT